MHAHAAPFEQPAHFEFTPDNFKKAEQIIARYPAGRQASAVMPLLMIAQRQHENWLPKVAMDYVASILSMAPMRVYEVATFYTMYNLAPVGKHFVEICTTTPCWLRGSDEIVHACESHLGIKMGETTPDGKFTIKEAECLGACVNAPMIQIGDDYFEDLTPASTVAMLDALARGQDVKPGPQSGRKSSEPVGVTSSGVTSGGKKDKGATGANIDSETAKDTVMANAPGKHPEGDKRYTAEQNPKK